MFAVMKKVEINDTSAEMVEFAQTVDFTELFAHIRTLTGVDCVFHTPMIKTVPYDGIKITFKSENIAAHTGLFAPMLSRCYFHSFNSGVHISKKTQKLTYGVDVNIRYEHKDGSVSSMDLLSAWYTGDRWLYSDSGYQTVNTRVDEHRVNARVKLNGWVDGAIDGFRFHAKVYDAGSKYGINKGRVSKLLLQDRNYGNKTGKPIAAYDRGWDLEPADDKNRELLQVLLNYLEELPIEKSA